jgi:hypothetical protein
MPHVNRAGGSRGVLDPASSGDAPPLVSHRDTKALQYVSQ